MADSSELRALFSLVTDRPGLNHVEGLEPFRSRLEQDEDGRVLRFLTRKLANLKGGVRGGVAFVIAEHYLKSGDLEAIERLFATDDADVKKSVLNALWGKPPASNPGMGPGIIALSLRAVRHQVAAVRAEACSVIQNQCDWGVDVRKTADPLLSLLKDSSGLVRMQAACAVGNLARRKYEMSRHIKPLGANLKHADFYVRTWSAWALWEMSRFRHDIGTAVANLARLLASEDEDDDDARKHAAGALLHHAKKSADNARQVRQCTDAAKPDRSRTQIRRFEEQLAKLGRAA